MNDITDIAAVPRAELVVALADLAARELERRALERRAGYLYHQLGGLSLKVYCYLGRPCCNPLAELSEAALYQMISPTANEQLAEMSDEEVREVFAARSEVWRMLHRPGSVRWRPEVEPIESEGRRWPVHPIVLVLVQRRHKNVDRRAVLADMGAV